MIKKCEDKNANRSHMDRREFMKKSAIVLGGAAVTPSLAVPKLIRKAEAAKRDHILIGRPNPGTGSLASFGEATPWTDNKALAEINKDGGIYLKELDKKLRVEVKIMDTESDPTKAAEVASRCAVGLHISCCPSFAVPTMTSSVAPLELCTSSTNCGTNSPISAPSSGGSDHLVLGISNR